MCSAIEKLTREMAGESDEIRAKAHRRVLGILRPSNRIPTEFGEREWGSKEFPASFNARAERLESSPLWRQMEPGTMELAGYFEPRGTNRPREAWYVPGPMTVRIVANEDFFSIVTQEPWEEMTHVHNRMPAVLGHPNLNPVKVGPAVWKNKPRDVCVDPRKSYVDEGQNQLF